MIDRFVGPELEADWEWCALSSLVQMGIRAKPNRSWMEIDLWSSHVAGRVRSGMQLLCLVIKEDIIKRMGGNVHVAIVYKPSICPK